jgi:hypothetical protein
MTPGVQPLGRITKSVGSGCLAVSGGLPARGARDEADLGTGALSRHIGRLFFLATVRASDTKQQNPHLRMEFRRLSMLGGCQDQFPSAVIHAQLSSHVPKAAFFSLNPAA